MRRAAPGPHLVCLRGRSGPAGYGLLVLGHHPGRRADLGAGGLAERKAAYARAKKELDGLIVLPAVTRAAIERKIAGEIEA